MATITPNVPISQILKNKSEFENEPKKKSREDWRKAKELEEARKAGTAPAAVDEEGKDINPHIPQYISATPWYYGANGPTLKHQRPQPEKQTQYSKINEWYKRGVDTSNTVLKYRKGACENCGAMTHKRKDCMERPRKLGAKYTNSKIAPDEFQQPNLNISYDGKRDRWSGYDPSEHNEIIEEFQKIEEAKRQLRAEKLNANDDGVNSEKNSEKETEFEEKDEEDEDKYVDEVDMPGTKVDSKQRITVRNLRIREDTAKYLRNLNPDSAYYDPKTRSMRGNPYVGTAKENDGEFTGENFARFSGDTRKHALAQVFAWEAYSKGVDVHLLAEPTKLEKLKQEFEKQKEQFKNKIQDSVLEKYGGKEHLETPPKSLLLAQTEDFVIYSRLGKVIKGKEKDVIRSKYEEDIFINNHHSVWGSYWKNGKWGYKCCHSFIKNSYCLGEVGKNSSANSETNQSNQENLPSASEDKSSKIESTPSSDSDDDSVKSSDEEEVTTFSKTEKKKKHKKKHKKNKKKSKESWDEKLKKALDKEEKSQKEAENLLKLDERKRPYNSMYEVKKPTEEEMEAYYLKRKRPNDPMADFL